MARRGGAVCIVWRCKMDDSTGASAGPVDRGPGTCVETQAERGSRNLPTDTDRWVGSSGGEPTEGLDWLTGSLSVGMIAAYPGITRDSPAVDPSAELSAVASMIAAFGGYRALGPSTQHGTQWYREGTFADDKSWSVEWSGKGKNAGSVVLTLKGQLLARMPDRGLTGCRLLAALGVRMRRVDVMAEGPLVPGALYALYRLLEDGSVRLPRGLGWSYDANSKRGHTLYLGSQSSAEYVCIYDRRGVTRAEVRGHGQVAEAMVRALVESGDPRALVVSRLDRYGAAWASAVGQSLLMALGASDQVPRSPGLSVGVPVRQRMV